MSDIPSVDSLFFIALEKENAAERAAYLDSACVGDPHLRQRLERLLNAHTKLGDFLSRPAGEQLAGALQRSDITHDLDASVDGRDAVPTAQENPSMAETEGGRSGDEAGLVLGFLAPPTRSDSLGRIGHYEVLEVLGHGGFGIVLRAFDEVLQRVVALKVMAPQLAITSPARKRFLREARSSARVRHENVVQVYAVEEQPLPYLVMEFIPGETLQQRIDRMGPLDTVEVVQIGQQLAEGLAAAHITGLIHRDIKPGNILIESCPHLRAKITDFGMARAADDASLTQSGLIAGTPMFMAPEQANGESLDHRADLFSLGSVLYTMCTGRPPFRAKNTFAVLKRVAEDSPRPIPEIIPEVPQWLCELIAKLHAKNPKDRFATAREVADLLTRHLEQLRHPWTVEPPQLAAPAAVVPPTEKPPEITPTNRQPRARVRRWAAVAAGFLLLIGGLGFTEGAGVSDLRSTVIRLFSPEGTLVVEVDDPGVSVKVDGSEIVITGAGAKEIRLKPGPHNLEASKDGKLVRQELILVTQSKRTIVRVSREPLPPQGFDVAAWERVVAGMSAAEQVKAVGARLKALNPGFDGAVVAEIEKGVVTGLAFATDHVGNISPLRALARLQTLKCRGVGFDGLLIDLSPLSQLPLTYLDCVNNQVSDLSPLRKMKLLRLDCSSTKVTDLSPLRGMPLVRIDCSFTKVADLSPLAGMKLTNAGFDYTNVADLTPLKGMPLSRLEIAETKVTDLSPLRGMKLRALSFGDTKVSDLSPLKDMKLEGLYCQESGVTDLSPLKGMPLKDLYIGPLVTDVSPIEGMPLSRFAHSKFEALKDTKILRGIPTLGLINGKAPAEFWKALDAKPKPE